MENTSSYTVDDFLQAHIAFGRMKKPNSALRIGMVSVLFAACALCYSAVTLVTILGSVFGLLFSDFTFSDHLINVILSIVFIFLFLVVRYNILWRWVYWLDIKNATNNGTLIYSCDFDEDILEFKGSKLSTKFEWEFYSEILETEYAFLMIKGKKYHLVLKRWLMSAEAVNRFRDVCSKRLTYYKDAYLTKEK